MGRVAGVFDNPPGFPCTPPGVDILEGGKLTSNNVAGSSHDPLQSPAVASGAVSKPGGDAAGQDALHSAGVEGPEDSGARSKLPQPSQEEETLMCLLQHCICVSRPCEILGDVNATGKDGERAAVALVQIHQPTKQAGFLKETVHTNSVPLGKRRVTH